MACAAGETWGFGDHADDPRVLLNISGGSSAALVGLCHQHQLKIDGFAGRFRSG